MTTATPLDAALAHQVAPPGSLRDHALRYADPIQRDALRALFLVDDELNATARERHHDVAHTRLHWWHEELDRYAEGRPAHPALRTLLPLRTLVPDAAPRLQRLLEAAQIDLARLSFNDVQELDGYYYRNAQLYVLMGTLLAEGSPPAGDERWLTLGVALRRLQSLATLRSDAAAGRLHLALTELERLALPAASLQEAEWPEPLHESVKAAFGQADQELEAATRALDPTLRAQLRPLLVYAQLQRRLASRAVAARTVPAAHIELGAFEKPWLAWRAARRAR